ncbi:hypothetical protein BHE74_00024098 [Ensete ventricosum]|nr:hypothetical protein BHE74_00024098 [Ensete ventricosum]
MPHNIPAYSSERVDSQLSNGIDRNSRLEERSLKLVNSRNLNFMTSAAQCSLLRHQKSKSSHEKMDDVDDFRVPTFDKSEPDMCSDKDTSVMGSVKLTSFNTKSQQKSPNAIVNSSIRYSTSYFKHFEQTDVANMQSRKFGGSEKERQPEESLVIAEHREKSPPSARVEERPIVAKVSNHAKTRDVTKKSHCGDVSSCQESYQNGDLNERRTMNKVDVVENGDASQKRQRTSNMVDNGNLENNAKKNGFIAESKDETSEASNDDSLSGLEIYPDDVVGVIGPKHFWKARRAFINCKIKTSACASNVMSTLVIMRLTIFILCLKQVQTSIAASPHLLLEGNPYLSKSPVKAPSKVPLLDCNMNSQQDAVKQKDDECQKLDQKKELQMENIARAPPPTCGERTDGGSRRQVLESGPHSADPPSHSTAPDKNPSPWCLHPPANQWLVPVMSPSEGLIYKPYTGSCAPASSFLAPVYGSCMPFGVPSLAGNFMNTAYGVPASHRPPDMGVLAGASAIASNYFPAYGIPSMNPIVSTSAVEQVTKLACSRPNGHVDQHSMISCNMSHPRSEEISGCFVKFQASKDTELQASSASSPCEKAQTEATDVLPLFPMAPNKENLVYPSRCSGRDSQAQAIKVVPHNARSAIESAARIFQSIQEERLQHD